MNGTLRLIIPYWQAGNRTEFFLGTEILSMLAPENQNQKTVKVDIEPPNEKKTAEENQVIGQSAIMKEVAETKRILEEEQPEKVITLGGTCLVSQAPFDYLKGKYGDDLGIIWIDAHPDISTPEETNEAHTMVLGNLIGAGNQALSEQVEHPFKADEVLYVGLQNLHEKEQKLLDHHGFNYQVQTDGILSAESVRQCILDNAFKKIAVHFDIDVLSPAVFRDTYMAEPGIESFPAAAGKMDFNGLKEIFNAVFSSSEVVGLTVCEYMPFDAVNLKSFLSGLDIFQEK